MTAALGSGSAPRPLLPRPRARALPLLLGSGPSPFEAIRQPSSGRPKAEDLRPNPLTAYRYSTALRACAPELFEPAAFARVVTEFGAAMHCKFAFLASRVELTKPTDGG
jgi:hypothetical protein